MCSIKLLQYDATLFWNVAYSIPVLEKMFNKCPIFTFVQSNWKLDQTLNECLDPIGWCYACAVHFRPQSAYPPRPPVTWPQNSQGHLLPAPQGPTGDPCPPRPPVTWPQGPPGGLCPPSPHQPARQPEQRVLFSLSHSIWWILFFYSNIWKLEFELDGCY